MPLLITLPYTAVAPRLISEELTLKSKVAPGSTVRAPVAAPPTVPTSMLEVASAEKPPPLTIATLPARAMVWLLACTAAPREPPTVTVALFAAMTGPSATAPLTASAPPARVTALVAPMVRVAADNVPPELTRKVPLTTAGDVLPTFRAPVVRLPTTSFWPVSVRLAETPVPLMTWNKLVGLLKVTMSPAAGMFGAGLAPEVTSRQLPGMVQSPDTGPIQR